MNVESIFWAITLTLFLGSLGLPLPENPILMGGGYAIYQKVAPAVPSLITWCVAILVGDVLLFAISFWFFTRPAMAAFLKRYTGAKRFEAYRNAFAARGGWTLFLARFAFGLRAVAYIAAGAAHYPWKRFLLVDGLSVVLQVLLFVGLGYYAGERIDWAQGASHKIYLFIGILAVSGLIITWSTSFIVRRFTVRRKE